MFSFLPEGDFICLYIYLYSLLSLLLVNTRKALPGQGSHMNIFMLKTVAAMIYPPTEPEDALFSEVTQVHAWEEKVLLRSNNKTLLETLKIYNPNLVLKSG